MGWSQKVYMTKNSLIKKTYKTKKFTKVM